MSALLFVCPTSGREISTGVDIDLGSFYQGLPRVLADIKCPDCGLTHNLFEVQSRLTDEPTGCSQCEATAPEPRNPSWDKPGGKEAAEIRDRIASVMTAMQIAEARKLAREWKPK